MPTVYALLLQHSLNLTKVDSTSEIVDDTTSGGTVSSEPCKFLLRFFHIWAIWHHVCLQLPNFVIYLTVCDIVCKVTDLLEHMAL